MSLNKKIDSFLGKKVWVIGASSGIGQATAHALLKLGAKVALSSRRTSSLEKIKAAYPHENSLVVGCDVLDEASLKNAYKTIKDSWGDLDLLLYVAGSFSQAAGGVLANNVAVWDGTSWAPLLSGQSNGVGVGSVDSAYALGAQSRPIRLGQFFALGYHFHE